MASDIEAQRGDCHDQRTGDEEQVPRPTLPHAEGQQDGGKEAHRGARREQKEGEGKVPGVGGPGWVVPEEDEGGRGVRGHGEGEDRGENSNRREAQPAVSLFFLVCSLALSKNEQLHGSAMFCTFFVRGGHASVKMRFAEK